MKTFLLLLFVCPFLTVRASTYYFSANSGDDSRSFSQAKNSSTPWRSLSKLNSIVSSLQPGDFVLLKRGETFYGTIKITKSGSSSSPIVIGAYGSGNKPVITSLQNVSGWVSKGNGIYESSNTISGTKVNIVLMNGVQQELGRYPNSNTTNGGFLTFESHSGTTSITDNQLTSSPNWTGADVVIRKRRWIIDRDLITSHSGTKITYKASASYVYTPSDKFGYFIENSLKTLDKLGEWYYNPSTHKLSVYFGSNGPSSYHVQAATADNLVYAEKANYVTLDNLTIKGANANAVYNRYGSHVSITNCDLSFASLNGVQAFMAANFKVENSTIDNCNTDGIDLGYAGDYATIRNNKITNTFTFAGMGASGDGKGMAIHSNASGATIEYNEIRNCGFTAINFAGSNTTIKNNYIDKFCYLKDDGAGIYTFGGPGTDIPTVTNRKIIGNIVMNGVGAPNGAYNPWGVLTEGIYLDNGSMNIEVTGNSVLNVSDMGLYLNGAKNIKISGNTFFDLNIRHSGLFESANHPLVRNNSISNNILFTRSVSEDYITRRSPTNDMNLFASISGNYYARLSDANTTTIHNKVKAYDANAKFKDYSTAIRYEVNPTKAAKTIALDATYADAKSVTYSGSITLQPYSCAILIKTGSSTTSSSPTVSITSPTTNSSYNANSSITINATAKDADGSIKKVEFYKGSTLLATETTEPYSYTWSNVPAGSYTLTAKATDNSGKVTTSSSVYISVGSSTTSSYPKVSITSPTSNSTYSANSSITINATASDADGSVKKVEFYKGSTLLHTETTAPYSWTWGSVPTGSYTLTAKATDNSGKVTTSSPVYISVGSSTSSYPTVSITSPTSNSSYKANSSITITASAKDADGTIKKVEFYKGSTLLHTESDAPYTWTWSNVSSGSYTLTAKATDNSGKVTTSAAVKISVYASRDNFNNSTSEVIIDSSITNSSELMVSKVDKTPFTFSFFPNPAINKLQIDYSGKLNDQKANLSIINMSGSIIRNIPVILSGKRIDIDVSSLTSGTYIIRLMNENAIISKKFIKIN